MGKRPTKNQVASKQILMNTPFFFKNHVSVAFSSKKYIFDLFLVGLQLVFSWSLVDLFSWSSVGLQVGL